MMLALVKSHGRALELLHEIRNAGKDDADALFNMGVCQRELGDIGSAAQTFKDFADRFPGHSDGWASLADCQVRLGKFEEGIGSADRAIKLDSSSQPAWTIRGDALQRLGKLPEAVADYKAALKLAPADGETLKKASLCLLQLDQGSQAIELCRDSLKVHPEMLTAKIGADWVLSKLVPFWHVPMMNDEERNKAYYDGLESVVAPEKVVFEIGTGSGLLAMMAARLGAKTIYTCEAVGLVADTARKIVARNNYQDRITILAKSSQAVRLGTDLPARADMLVHEIFSSELLGEHVLPAIEDAKHRLLRPGGEVLPSAASIMIALVGGDDLGKSLHVAEAFGFDLRDFNAIHPRKQPLYREDLAPVLLSDGIEAFRFDFRKESTFPGERKQIEITARKEGLCYGVIQWLRIEMSRDVRYENHPSRRRPSSNWQHTIYGFEEPIRLAASSIVSVTATHDRSRSWFELAA